jgi:hypothetical protein
MSGRQDLQTLSTSQSALILPLPPFALGLPLVVSVKTLLCALFLVVARMLGQSAPRARS